MILLHVLKFACPKFPGHRALPGSAGRRASQIPSGPVIDSEGLAVQTGSGAPVKKSYEEVHGKAALRRSTPKGQKNGEQLENTCRNWNLA